MTYDYSNHFLWLKNFKFWLYFDLSISCVCNRNAEYKAYVRNQSNRL